MPVYMACMLKAAGCTHAPGQHGIHGKQDFAEQVQPCLALHCMQTIMHADQQMSIQVVSTGSRLSLSPLAPKSAWVKEHT